MKHVIALLMLLMGLSIYCYQITVGPFIPRALFSDDLDRDGYIDLVVTTSNFNTYILYNNGDGTYNNTFLLPVAKIKSSTNKLYDFDNDGWTDINGFIEIIDEYGNTHTKLRIYLNNSGVFNENDYIDLPSMPQLDAHWVLYGDWNGDDYTDVLVWDDDMYYVVQNNGDLSFTATGETIVGMGFGAFRDLDSDGSDELFISTSEDLLVYKYPDLTSPFLIFPNNGYLRTIETEDMDIDGDLDIFTSFCDGNSYSEVCIYENIGNYNYLAHNSIYYDQRDLDGVLLKDLTSDGYLDILNYAYVSPYNPIGFDYPFDLFYLLSVSMPACNIYSEYSGFDYRDVDNNGFLDFVLIWMQNGIQLRVYYNEGMGYFSDNPIVSNEDELIPNPKIELTAYPNPFVEKMNIEYTPCTTGDMVLNIYNIKGQKVRSYHKTAKADESQHLQWDGNDENGRTVSKGIYICNIHMTNKKKICKKIVKM